MPELSPAIARASVEQVKTGLEAGNDSGPGDVAKIVR